MRFPIVIEPPVCTISTAGGSAKHTMENKGDRKLAFVFGMTDDSRYWVNTTHGFIEAGETKEINIWRDVGASLHKDRMKVYFRTATGPDALEHFEGADRGEGSANLTIRLNAPIKVGPAPPSP